MRRTRRLPRGAGPACRAGPDTWAWDAHDIVVFDRQGGTVSARATVVLLVAFAASSGPARSIDRSTPPTGQLLVSVVAWLFLGAALLTQSVPIRRQVLALVAIATILECIGSLVWGAYIYRLANLPLYVPAGHGLFYLTALRAAALPVLMRNARAIVMAVTLGATGWMAYGLIARPLPDLLGFVTWAVFLRFILRGRYPLLYAVSFAMTTAPELYGTSLGIWRWSPVLPALMLPAGNPPTGIGAGYAAMDALTRRIVARIERGRAARRRAGTADAAALPHPSVPDTAAGGAS